MLSTQKLKQRLLLELEQLSKEQLLETLRFMRQLQGNHNEKEAVPINTQKPEDDPILQAIGLADVPPFADDIDTLLYEVY